MARVRYERQASVRYRSLRRTTRTWLPLVTTTRVDGARRTPACLHTRVARGYRFSIRICLRFNRIVQTPIGIMTALVAFVKTLRM